MDLGHPVLRPAFWVVKYEFFLARPSSADHAARFQDSPGNSCLPADRTPVEHDAKKKPPGIAERFLRENLNHWSCAV
jgi:hypothetical protein